MSNRSVSLLVGLGLALGAAQAVSAQGDLCARVLVGTESINPLGPRTGAAISATTDENLQLAVVFLSEVQGDHLLEVRLITPRGHHYQTLAVPLTSEAGEHARVRAVPTYPRPLPVQVVQPVTLIGESQQRQAVTVWVPMAGTSITENSLYGQWRVELALDGVSMRCPVDNAFQLRE